MPVQVTKDGQNVQYVYSAAGEKLQVSYGSSTVLNYNGPVVREGSSLKYIITNEGRYVMNGTSGVAEYHLTDHLGNVRVALSASGSVVQSNSYYPFGSLLSQSGSSDNRYQFNSKEEQEITGWLDYGWRMYDAVIGRWGGLDPMAETNLSFSPFNYCSNNAINRIDPDGARDDSWLLNIATGELSWWDSQGGNEFQMIHVVSPASIGGLLHLGTSILKGSMSKYFFGSYSGGYAFSTRDYWQDLNFNLRGYKGYQYDMDDLKMRYKVLNSGSHHLKVALLSMENRGWAEPLTSSNYWNTYGHTLGMLNLMGTYIPAGVWLSAAAQQQTSLPQTRQFKYVKQYSHVQARVLKRGVSQEDINDALNNPLKIKGVKSDVKGKSQQYIGRKATVVINPISGKVITSWKTGTKTIKKYSK